MYNIPRKDEAVFTIADQQKMLTFNSKLSSVGERVSNIGGLSSRRASVDHGSIPTPPPEITRSKSQMLMLYDQIEKTSKNNARFKKAVFNQKLQRQSNQILMTTRINYAKRENDDPVIEEGEARFPCLSQRLLPDMNNLDTFKVSRSSFQKPKKLCEFMKYQPSGQYVQRIQFEKTLRRPDSGKMRKVRAKLEKEMVEKMEEGQKPQKIKEEDVKSLMKNTLQVLRKSAQKMFKSGQNLQDNSYQKSLLRSLYLNFCRQQDSTDHLKSVSDLVEESYGIVGDLSNIFELYLNHYDLDIEEIQQRIVPLEFQELFGENEGFAKFMEKYWQAFKNLGVKVKEVDDITKLKCIVFHSIYYLKNILSIRLDWLLNSKKQSDEKNLKNLETKHEREIDYIKTQHLKQTFSLEAQIEVFKKLNQDQKELIDQLRFENRNMKDKNIENQRDNENLKKTVENLNEELTYAIADCKNYEQKFRERFADSDDEKMPDIDMFNFDQLKLPENDQAISNLTFDLQAVISQLKKTKQSTSKYQKQIEGLIDDIVVKKIDHIDKEQERIFQNLVQSSQIKQKYVVRSEYELVKNLCKIFVCTGSQTEYTGLQYPSHRSFSERAITFDPGLSEHALTNNSFEPKLWNEEEFKEQEIINIQEHQPPSINFNLDFEIAREKNASNLIKQELNLSTDDSAKNYKILSREKLFNVVDDLLMNKLQQIFDSQNAWKGQVLESENVTPGSNNKQVRVLIQSNSLIEYAYKYYLKQFGLKSQVICSLNSIAIGLQKYYEQDKVNNFYAMYLLKIFDFETVESKGQPTEQDYLKSHLSYEPLEGTDPKKVKFSEHQLTVILWARKVFLKAKQLIYRKSIEHAQKCGVRPKEQKLLESKQKMLESSQMLKNGGQIDLNFLMRLTKQAFVGNIDPEIEVKSPKEVEVHQQFLQMLVNIKIDEITIFDIENPDLFKQNKKICDFPKNYQLLAGAKFLIWKFLSLILYSEVDLDQLAHIPANSGNDKFIDLQIMLNVLNTLILGHSIQKKKPEIFNKIQQIIIINYLTKLGVRDFRCCKISHLKALINKFILKNTVLDLFDRDLEINIETADIFKVSFTQFCKICLDQWKLNIEQQIMKVKKIFIQGDLNGDGVMTLEEFWLNLVQMEEKMKNDKMVKTKNQNIMKSMTMLSPNKREISPDSSMMNMNHSKSMMMVMQGSQDPKITSQRALDLFSEALELSIAEVKGNVDKITPLAFTKVIMKHGVGGFGFGIAFSDLRYTLREFI